MFVIDFHSHILPGIDDGSNSLEMSEEMLRISSDQGVHVQVLTPHFYASRMDVDNFLRAREKAYQKLLPVAKRMGINLRIGAEVAFFNNMSQSDKLDKFVINGTKVILIEMPFRQWTDRIVDEIELIADRGYFPMIAHIERYFSYQRDKGPMERLLLMNRVIFQVNCESLNSLFRRGSIVKALEESVFVLGSDAHNTDKRSPNISIGRRYISSKLGKRQLKEMDLVGNVLLGYRKFTR